MHERDILLAALEKARPVEREAYLTNACGADGELRDRVDALLRATEVQDSFLENPAVETELLSRETDVIRQKCAEHDELSLDFLQPTDDPAALGRLGQYTITDVIGRGGMGVVLKARDAKLNRVVAIKVLAPELASNPTARKRFQREAHAAAAVVHQHIVTIHAVDEDRLPYLVMEYIDGQSLKEKIDREGHLKLVEILRIGQQVASGLAAAHAHGLMHRDVKPANILLENGIERVRITDFGLARAVDDVGMTRTGEVAGTPEYMSPEQAQGLSMDGRSDLFSFGCVLYAMCTGRPPFRAETVFATARRVCEDNPRPIREVNPEIPEWLVAIIDRLLAKKPEERFQTATEVADLLGQRLAELQHPSLPAASATTVPESAIRNRGTRDSGSSAIATRTWAVAAAAALLLLLGISLTEATGVTQLAPTLMRIVTGKGTLLVEVNDPAVKVTVEGDGGLVITGAGLHEVHLKPGKYQLKADKDGKLVPLDQELVTITRGGEKVVRVRLENPAASVPEAGAFVLLGGQDAPERKFDTLAEAVLGASDGDTIEVRGNGPFETRPITIRRPLVVRAGNGFAPVIRLRPGETGHVLRSSAPLVLEGLEIRYRREELKGELGERDLLQRDGVIRCSGGSPAIANCRLIADGKRTILQSYPSPSARIVNSELLNSAWEAISWGNTQGRLELDNCIVAAPGAGTLFGSGSNKFSLSVSRSTSLTGWQSFGIRHSPALPASHEPEDSRTPSISIELTGNVLDAPAPVVQIMPLDAFVAATFDLSREKRNLLAPQLFAWREQYNLYRHGSDFCSWVVKRPGGGESRSATTRDEWTALFQLENAHSLHGQPRFRGGDLRARMAADPLSLSPDDFRLQPDSPGYRAGKDGKDLGADVDLVGPGPAYERWKKTPEYQEWLKDTGQLRAEAPKPEPKAFSVMAGKGALERKFDTLSEAVQSASSGDTIEVRGNGPFVSQPINLAGTALSIRAGERFRPVLQLQPRSADDAAALLTTNAPLVLEGLELHGDCPLTYGMLNSSAPLYVGNCRFHGKGAGKPRGPLVLANNAPLVELRNCEFLGHNFVGAPAVRWNVPSKGQLSMENCCGIDGRALRASILSHDPKDVSIRLARNTWGTKWSPLMLAQERPASVFPAGADTKRIRWNAVANVFDAEQSVFNFDQAGDGVGRTAPPPAEAEALLARMVNWQEEKNVYSVSGFLTWSVLIKPTGGLNTLADWNQFWKLTSTGSFEGRVRFQGGNLRARILAGPESVGPADFRLQPDSPGYRAGKGGKDLGADVDLVGPGPAYERWKQTPEYQEWLKDTGQKKSEESEVRDQESGNKRNQADSWLLTPANKCGR